MVAGVRTPTCRQVSPAVRISVGAPSVARAAERAKGIGESRRALDHGRDPKQRILDLVTVEVDVLSAGLADSDVQFSEDMKPEVPQRRQRLDEAERLSGVEAEGDALRAPQGYPDLEPVLEGFEALDVEGNLLGRRRFAVDADSGLGRDPPVEELSPLPLAEVLGERPAPSPPRW
jgi:hypothetical protein